LPQATVLNPICKSLLEKCYEAIFDAGLHPSDLEKTNTGIFLGITFSEFELYYSYYERIVGANTVLWNLKSVLANKISHHLKLQGISITVDTACSSSGYALENAVRAIRIGQCNAALVCTANFIFSEGCCIQFARLGVLSPTGQCRPFDNDGVGYVRSEAVTAMLLQKAKYCKRIYAKIIHIKTNCDGFKEYGITYPSGRNQTALLKELYNECEVDPVSVSYIEAHGTGTMVGDPEELASIDEFFTPGRTKPLLIGSVKCSIGHTEPCAMLSSVVKVILAFETNMISPNINYNSPKKNLHGIIDGRIKIVVENTPLQENEAIIGVSNFGFGGANAHVILKRCAKLKYGAGHPTNGLPRLVCVSGRTQKGVEDFLDDIAEHFDEEHIALIHNVFRKPIKNHLYRGYGIILKQGVMIKSSKPVTDVYNKKLVVYFGGITFQTKNLLCELLHLPLLFAFNSRLMQFFVQKDVDIECILRDNQSNVAQLLINLLTQLTCCELLKSLEIRKDFVFANSIGYITKAYSEKVITFDQFLEFACIMMKHVQGKKSKSISCNRIIKKMSKQRSSLLSEFQEILHSNKETERNSRPKADFYFLNNLINGLFDFENTSRAINKHSVLLEIGSRFENFERKCPIIVMNLTAETRIIGVLKTIGRLYELGKQPQIQRLYPKVQFPVSRGTRMISPKIKWQHGKAFPLPIFDIDSKMNEIKSFYISLEEEQWASLDGHVIDGRILFPATSYLFLVWTVLADMHEIDIEKQSIVFENCRFLRACQLTRNAKNYLKLTVMLQKRSGLFEITENDVVIMTGTVCDGNKDIRLNLPQNIEEMNGDSLSLKDIYKELRLRGYNYKGDFKGLTQCNSSVTHGKAKWLGNWVSFMDTILQMKILGEDTRLLYVPTRFSKVIINPVAHLEEVRKQRLISRDETVELPVYIDYTSGVISSGGIELRGLLASSISRRKPTAFPILEKYVFVPNEGTLNLESAIRLFMQLALEHHCGLKVTVIELIDEATEEDLQPIGPIINDVLGDQPLVHANVTILSSKNIETNVTVENTNLKDITDTSVAVASRLLSRTSIFQKILNATKETAFIITREPLGLNVEEHSLQQRNIEIFSVIQTDKEKLLFLKKKGNPIKSKPVFINISCQDNDFKWLNQVKAKIKKHQEVVLWSQNEALNGLIGLVNCIRKEPETQNIRGVFIVDTAPSFDPTLPFYKNQLEKKMALNIFMNGSWGTYRHFLLENLQEIENEYCYVNSTVRGDLSSIKWIEGPLSHVNQPENTVKVCYAALNFRDVMTASGRINVDVITRDRREQECVQGFEFSGITSSGERVMGMVSQGALATFVKADRNLIWKVPKSWSLREAATVPVVYGTCLYALIVVGKLKSTDSVLIHSGTGGIGQAAINLCLWMGCKVFTTVGTQEKRAFIAENFPQIKEEHIGNSRDLTFKKMIMKETNGKGVDVILNSLVEEKLSASVRCLSQNGRFLEIGKFDLASDNRLNLLSFRLGGSYHGVMLDKFFNEPDSAKMELNRLVQKYIDMGAVKPLSSTVFKKDEVEQAFRFMTTGRHMGKVLVQIQNQDVQTLEHAPTGLPRYFCDASKTYIICGGLGGFGLELVDWLVLRGAKNLILTSRKGVTTGYQNYRISIWKKYGCNINISTEDITTLEGCLSLVKHANAIGPVKAIFNLAVVLRDAILENQTDENYQISFGPKAHATRHLDEVSRKHCPELRDFVVFSSVSCGRGNAGQTNYGMSNSVMERICEQRRRDGYPGLAIQWGAVGDVGLVAELQEDRIEIEIGGTLQQNIASCLEILDGFLRQNENTVVSSIVVAEKKNIGISGNVLEVVSALIGIRDLKSVSMQATLTEIGMDSMNAVEVKQTLEREFNIFLTPNEIRSLTLARSVNKYIKELQDTANDVTENNNHSNDIDWIKIFSNVVNAEEQTSFIVKLRTKQGEQEERKLPKIIVLPGIEGVCCLLENLTELLDVEAYGVNYLSNVQEDSFPKMADMLLPHIVPLLERNEPFNLVAHSFGSVLALEIVRRLEDIGYGGRIIFLDGSLVFLKELAVRISGDNIENSLIAILLKTILSIKEVEKAMIDICKCSNLADKLQLLGKNLKVKSKETLNIFVNSVNANLQRMKLINYEPDIGKLKAAAFLAKASFGSIKIEEDDYDLNRYFEKNIDIKVFDGSHTSMLQNVDLADSIMEIIGSK
ncbi:fatty acid synthase-like, partial [Euwallacea similis]|uniref:fatty acid synthase-like n=1 Tax=Euwallacea similis TaxID=1736056 RepID=UPI0034500A61